MREEGRLPERATPLAGVCYLVAAAGYVSGWDIRGDEGAGADIGARANIDTADDEGAPADESAVLYDWCWLLGTWFVPVQGWIKLPVYEISSDAAASTDAGGITDVAFDY